MKKQERTHCGNNHEYTPENTYLNSKGHRICRKCRVAGVVAYQRTPAGKALRRARNRRYQHRLEIWKLFVGCVDCGYNENADAMEFDHVDRALKSADVGRFRSWEACLREIEKCEVRCANCHKIRTMQQHREDGAVRSLRAQTIGEVA